MSPGDLRNMGFYLKGLTSNRWPSSEKYNPVGCFVLVSYCWDKDHDQNQLGDESFFDLLVQTITEGNKDQGCGGMQLTGPFSRFAQSAFLYHPGPLVGITLTPSRAEPSNINY